MTAHQESQAPERMGQDEERRRRCSEDSLGSVDESVRNAAARPTARLPRRFRSSNAVGSGIEPERGADRVRRHQVQPIENRRDRVAKMLAHNAAGNGTNNQQQNQEPG